MTKRTGLLATLALLALGSCGPAPQSESTPAPTPKPMAAATPVATPMPSVAVAELSPLGSSGVTGRVTFTETASGVKVDATISGLAPGDHGFHVHEFGDCSSPDGTSAGPHFNPAGHPHGPMDPAQPHHAGDLGNIVADASGTATLTISTNQFTLGTGTSGLAGRSVIVHEKRDDLTSQPAGDAGARLACGVIMIQGGSTTPVTGAGAAAPGMSPAMSPVMEPAMASPSPITTP